MKPDSKSEEQIETKATKLVSFKAAIFSRMKLEALLNQQGKKKLIYIEEFKSHAHKSNISYYDRNQIF